jgi:hypothetical protein
MDESELPPIGEDATALILRVLRDTVAEQELIIQRQVLELRRAGLTAECLSDPLFRSRMARERESATLRQRVAEWHAEADRMRRERDVCLDVLTRLCRECQADLDADGDERRSWTKELREGQTVVGLVEPTRKKTS